MSVDRRRVGATETSVCAASLVALTSAAHNASGHHLTNSGLVALIVLGLSLGAVVAARPSRVWVLPVAVLSQLTGHLFLVSSDHHAHVVLPEIPVALAHLAAALVLGEVLLHAGRAADMVRAALQRVVRLLLGVLAPAEPPLATPTDNSGHPHGRLLVTTRPLRGPPLGMHTGS